MDYRNLVEMHRRQAERLGPRPALRYKKFGLYHDIRWNTYRDDVLACASALVDVGIMPGDRVGLVAENRPEWLVADIGIMAAGAINVPPHAPLAARQIHFQLLHADVRWVFVSTAEQLAKVRSVCSELPDLRGIVVFDRAAAGADALSWEGFLQRGRLRLEQNCSELKRREEALGREDLATIMYTSGTTGNPKGVMLTHGNLLWNAWGTNEAWPRPMTAVLLNWLPFSHIYARTVDHYLGILVGLEMCLAESAETVVLNLAEVQPTHIASVPRFYEKVLAAAGPDPEARRRKLRAIFGPRIDWLNCGGAPLPLGVAQAYHDAGLLLLQGYGLTESSPVITFNSPGAYKLDTVGRPIPMVEVKIGADGEVLTRGPHVMRGYWKDPQATAETIDAEDWLHTGDLGSLDAEGFLKITGRKKELLVLSSGKKVAPTLVESLLLGEPCIDQAVVNGEARNFLSALIVPNWPNVRLALKAAGSSKWQEPVEILIKDAEVKGLLASRIEKALADVSPWERVKEFVILAEPFSVAREELTVSLKLRRQVIAEHYKDLLDPLYR